MHLSASKFLIMAGQERKRLSVFGTDSVTNETATMSFNTIYLGSRELTAINSNDYLASLKSEWKNA